jgi:hypothetical protein
MNDSVKYIVVLFTALACLYQTQPAKGQELLALGKRDKNAEIQTLNPKARKWLYSENEKSKKNRLEKFNKYAKKAVGRNVEKVCDGYFKVVWFADEIKSGDVLYDLEVSFDKSLNSGGIVSIVEKHALVIYHLRESDNKAFVKILDHRSYKDVIIELSEESNIIFAEPNTCLDIEGKPRKDVLLVAKVLDLVVKPDVTSEDVDSICRQYNLKVLDRLSDRIMKKDPSKTYKGPESYSRSYIVEILNNESTVYNKAIIMKDPRVESVSMRFDAGPLEL